MATSGQTLNDRINAARYALAGQGLARCVCKATTEEVIGPKKKHLDYLLACTHEPNVSIPQLANLLIERTNHIQWVVVFKALVTVHHLMSYGNERFIQYLASSNYSFELSTFLDKTSGRDFSMSTFIRRYSRYINEKAISYRNSAFDFCKIKRGNEGVLRLMPIDRLLKTLPVLQNQLDALLEFDCRASDLNNGVINACFMLLFRDLIGLFACFNDGIINLLNRYFSLNKKMCREAFDLYRKFLVRMDKVSEFLKVAESVGIDKDEIPYPPRAPSSLIENLEHHLQALESNKKSSYKPSNNYGTKLGELTSSSSGAGLSESGFAISTGAMSSSSSIQANKSSASNSSSSMTTMNESELGLVGSSFKDDEVRRALEEEARVLSLYGSSEANRSSSRTSPGQLRASANRDGDSLKFAVTTTPKTIDDIFGDPNSFGSNNNNNNNHVQSRNKANGLSNPISFDATETVKQQLARPGASSIRTAIQSASTTLASADAKSGASSTKKASDDLFCLLDSASSAAAGSTAEPATSPALTKTLATPGSLITEPSAGIQDASRQQAALISPFENSSPFVLPTNGQGSQLVGATPLKPGNPFPEVNTNTFPSAFSAEALRAQPVLNPALKASNNLPQQTGANYTNLGGLEGFGDVLRPKQAGFRDPSQTNSDGSSANRPSFMNSGGLSSTGLFKGDLDSTLANLAQNLTFEGMSKPKK